MKKYTIHIEQDESGLFVGEIDSLPACYTQGRTLPELLERMIEVTRGSLGLQQDLCGKSPDLERFTISLQIAHASS